MENQLNQPSKGDTSGKCNIHGDTRYLMIKSINAAACVGCLKDGFYRDDVTEEVVNQFPQHFQE